MTITSQDHSIDSPTHSVYGSNLSLSHMLILTPSEQ